MKRAIKAIALSSLSVLAVAPALMAANPASAQPADRGMHGSYVGAGVIGGGIGSPSDDVTFGGNVQARIQADQRVPVSLRGSVLFNEEGTNIIPTLTYDAAIAHETNLFVGAGYSFADKGDLGPLGDQNAPVVTLGIEHAPLRNLVIYSDVKVGIDAYSTSNNAAASVQAGVGYRF